jgi:serine protease Do
VPRRLTVLPQTCEDGTVVGECSGSYLCTENKTLAFRCSECGCPGGLECIANECVSEEHRVERLIGQLEQSNVLIRSDAGVGSGVIIARQGSETFILTNRHVVDPDFTLQAPPNLEVSNYQTEVAQPVRVLVAPNQLDLAVVVVGKDIGPPADMDFNLSPQRGADVLVLGSPLGLQNSVTRGIVSNFYSTNTSSGFDFEAIQTDAAVNPGNSGGGVFLVDSGQLIGITAFKLVLQRGQLAEGLGFAMPIRLLGDFPLDEWTEIAPG